jgi:hypothetical protein
LTALQVVCIAEDRPKKLLGSVEREEAQIVNDTDKAGRKGRSEGEIEACPTRPDKVQCHREGYARYPILPDEFSPVLDAQMWPEDSEEKLVKQ